MLGEDYYQRLPLWLNEGLAQYESMKGWKNWFDTALFKVRLWLFHLGNTATLSNEKFILQSSRYPSENIGVYYAASWQFVQYLAKEYAMLSILKTMADGEDFVYALKSETGKTPTQLYNEWKNYYF